MTEFSRLEGFDWDEANTWKNWLKHGVDFKECEEIFANKPLFVFPDEQHSQTEERWYALGKTNIERTLFVVFTMREEKVRVISARDMNIKEKKRYEKDNKKT